MSEISHFGEHLTIDGYNGDFDLLNDSVVVKRCLDELPEKLDMHKMSNPEVYHAKGNNSKDPGGWTGFVVIEESHISIHTFPARGFVSIDVYTCNNGMNLDFIKNYFAIAFNLKKLETNFIIRGKEYPSFNIYEQ